MPTTFEPDFPAVYLDQLIMLDAPEARLAVVSRDPEPGELGVPVFGILSLDIVDTLPSVGAGIDLNLTRIWVGGQIAYDGNLGGFQPAFLGPANTVNTIFGPDTNRFTLRRDMPFSSEEVVTMRVVTTSGDGLAELDTSWTFTCADVTAPRVTGALGYHLRKVRVAFNEPMTSADSEDASDALNPASYTLVPADAERPTVPANVVAVEEITSTLFELTTDTPLALGASYLLVVSTAADAAGNAIVAPYNSALFSAYRPPRPDNRQLDIYAFLPAKNRREDTSGELRRFTYCVQEVLDLMLAAIDAFGDTLDPDTADDDQLSAMLADFGNPFAFDLATIDKRRLVQVLVEMYRRKGTAPGISDVVRFFLGLEVTFQRHGAGAGSGLVLGESELGVDWELLAGGSAFLYSFDAVVVVNLDETTRSQLRAIIEYLKPAHTHFIDLIEPEIPVEPDHVELGLSELDSTFTLH